MNAKQRKQSLANLHASAARVMKDAQVLEPNTPGISRGVAVRLDDTARAIEANAPQSTIAAAWSDLVSRMDYARRGVYARVDGSAWYYA